MNKSENKETRKRKRERRIAILLMLVFVVTTSLQVFFTDKAQGFGFEQSLFYFALLYLNVILILFLVFLVSRNLFRAYLARKSGSLGGGLRWRLVSSLLAFSMIPAVVLFVASSVVIRQGFDRWFGGQVSSALEDSQAIADVHYKGIEDNLDFFAERIVAQLSNSNRAPKEEDLRNMLDQFPVEGLELYRSLLEAPKKALGKDTKTWAVPRASTESLEKAFRGNSFHLIRQYGDGDLLQKFHPIYLRVPGVGTETFVVVLSYTVPLGLKTRIAKLKGSFVGYQKTRLLKDSLKTNYTLILFTFFIFIMFVVTWSGLYIAKSITDPVSELLKGTEAFRSGQWTYRIPTEWSPEKDFKASKSPGADLEVLKSAFNLMAEEVGQKSRQIEEANAQLVSLVRDLEERERYLENILSSIRRGVVVVGPDFQVQRVNVEALEFSVNPSVKEHWNPEEAVGRSLFEVFPTLGVEDEIKSWLKQSEELGGRPIDQILELRSGEGRLSAVKSIRATGIWVIDEYQQALGWLMILEDVSDAARVERLAAWQEVARRVAHEIKNPLTPIQISADRMRRRLTPLFEEDEALNSMVQECLGQISKQVKVIRDLVREFSEFAKLPEPNFERVDLVKSFKALVDDYRFTHPQTKIDYDVQEAVSQVIIKADNEYLRRVFVNLADNAIQSMEEAGVKDPQFKVSIEASLTAGAWVRIVFEDNGPGIPESMQEKIFDPYITSKASGFGLGLAIVRRIAIEHLGRVRCEPAEGARFVLELPTVAGENQLQV
ncbi:hypothetical protein GW916_09990 [bacterium]|nr:hypothetical protein [bacterium]